MPRGPVFNQFYGLRGRSLTTAISVVTGLIFVAFGYGQSDIGGLVVMPTFQRQFPRIDTFGSPTYNTAVEQGLVIGTWNAGCFVSALLTVFVGDKLGRKKCLMTGITILIIGKTLQATSSSYSQYIIGRFIAGFGNGINASTAPAWQAETSKAHRRGRMLLVTSGACLALGVAFAYWIDFAMIWSNPSEAAWRFPMALQAIFVLPCLLVLPKLPESPRWLILKGRQEEALEVLAALDDLHPTHEDVRAEFLQVKDAILQMASGTNRQALKMGEYRYLHRIILAVLLQIMQQWTGINLFIQYLASMFVNQAGVVDWPASILAAGAATEFFLISFVSVIGIDRFWGRRSLTLFGSVGMTASMVALACAASAENSAGNVVVACFIFIFISFFAIGWQGMAWLWAVELIPLPVRGPANALATSANWLSNFAVVVAVSPAFQSIKYKTYIIFAVINFVTIPIVYLLYPETGCRSLEEVDVLFHLAARGTTNPWLGVRHVAAHEPLWYGRSGKKSFAYEQSEWHQRFARVSSEEGAGSGGDSASPGSGYVSGQSGDGSGSTERYGRTMEGVRAAGEDWAGREKEAVPF